MKFKIKRDNYLTSKRYIWTNDTCLGYVFFEMKERQDIAWSNYRQDKSLKLNIGDRFITKYNAVAYPNESCGQHETLENACLALHKKQKEIFDNCLECDIVTIEGMNV